MPKAVEHIRRMRGGAQSHLMRCSDNYYYVVKFQNNPQHTRVLANELLGTILAKHLGLPAAPFAVVEVEEDLIRLTEELVVQIGLTRSPCKPGLQFGSRYPGDPAETAAFDFLPDDALAEVENRQDFLGMLVFDKWTCNTNGRQAVFFRQAGRTPQLTPMRALMIDNGFCFNAGEWNFPDAPLRGLYARQRVYDSVRALDSFEPWLARLEQRITLDELDQAAKQVPPEWYDGDLDALYALLERLDRRRVRVREQIEEARKSSRQPFSNWK
ncbi:MAG TPA: HipA family kinase [Candidatus Acidoferrales bacterium]|nr:HipA family kinase [Candidatus Acidoferrales bacterium]